MTDRSTIAFCGGGSGGHISPALTIAEWLLKTAPHSRFLFVTSSRDIDTTLLNASNLPLNCRTHLPLPLTSSTNRLRYLFNLCQSWFLCIKQFRKQRPAVVLGTGGFASVPTILAARWLRIPIALFEANVIPGRANRFLARFANRTFCGWPMAADAASKWRSVVQVTGVPVPTRFQQQRQSDAVNTGGRKLRVLILGGSQGARSLNKLVRSVLTSDRDMSGACHFVHQTGPEDGAAMNRLYRELGISADVLSFIDDVAAELQAADFVISRAGAMALAEIAATSTPAILLPLPSSADNHQAANAAYFRQAEAALVIDQSTDAVANARLLTQALHVMIHSQTVRSTLSGNVRCLAAPNAVSAIASSLSFIASPVENRS